MPDTKPRNVFLIGKKRLFSFFGFSFAAVGLLMLLISLTTDYWITTYERISVMNVTNIIAQNSGLWRKCWQSHELLGVTKATLWTDSMKIMPDHLVKNCSYIIYFKGKPKNAGELKAPEAILYEMRTSAVFSVISLIVLLIGSVLSWVTYCDDKLKKSIFVASGLYVLSGIFLLIGIVLYVGCISQAFDSKSDNTDSENSYLYEYGISFYLSVAAFVLSEFAGVFCIYLYIAKQKHLLKTLNASELFIKTNSEEEIVKMPNFNHIESQNVVNNPAEISPISNGSQPSYQAYRRYSEQLLLKLYPNIENGSQYSSPVKLGSTCNRLLNENRLNRDHISFIPEFRASQVSPIINYFNKKESKENVYESSPMVIFYNDSKFESNPTSDDKMGNSLILNQKTYFDSPMSESLSEVSKPGYPSNICNTCNLSLNLCNCACALLCLDKSNVKDQKIYSHINNVYPLPSTIYHNNHHYSNISNSNNIIITNNNSNNSTTNINNTTKSVEFEKLIQINANSFSKIGKERKITAV